MTPFDLSRRLAVAQLLEQPNTGPLSMIGHTVTQPGDKALAQRTHARCVAIWTAHRWGYYGQVVGFAKRRRA